MRALDQIFDAFSSMPLARASAWLLAINVGLFVLSVGGGELAVRAFRSRQVSQNLDPITPGECLLAACCVLLNTAVAIAGWWLWRHGWIRVRTGCGWRVGLDVLVLLLAMDLLMYAFHRLAHCRRVYRIVHSTHHRFDRPRPLSLFVLNPAEVLGFGMLWLVLLCIYPSTWTDIVAYLALNLSFGTIGHLGVEPFPAAWAHWPILRHVGSSTFHATHHGQPDVNFGFYTDLWDRLFRTTRKAPAG